MPEKDSLLNEKVLKQEQDRMDRVENNLRTTRELPLPKVSRR